jgi:hypothetical protein
MAAEPTYHSRSLRFLVIVAHHIPKLPGLVTEGPNERDVAVRALGGRVVATVRSFLDAGYGRVKIEARERIAR